MNKDQYTREEVSSLIASIFSELRSILNNDHLLTMQDWARIVSQLYTLESKYQEQLK